MDKYFFKSFGVVCDQIKILAGKKTLSEAVRWPDDPLRPMASYQGPRQSIGVFV